jgi:hypothetical protein
VKATVLHNLHQMQKWLKLQFSFLICFKDVILLIVKSSV